VVTKADGHAGDQKMIVLLLETTYSGRCCSSTDYEESVDDSLAFAGSIIATVLRIPTRVLQEKVPFNSS
jgi:hypothetical protein